MPSANLEGKTASWAGFLAGAGVGAAVMYLIDPSQGARRRGLLRDKATHLAHKTADGVGSARRDIAQRAQGTWASARARFSSKDVPDYILVERVRARLGRHVSHPHAIDVLADCGCVTLRGRILREEVEPLLRAVERVPGVYEIDNLLEPHERDEGIPALQGGRPRGGEHYDIFHRNWSPATRAIVGGIASALAAYGASRRGRAGTLACLTGAGFALRAATNLDARQLLGARAGRHAIDIEKTIHVAAPVSRVFDFLTRTDTFPYFMKNVLELLPTTHEGHYHWRLVGPERVSVEFDADITRFEPNRVLAWRTLQGSSVAHAGVIHFEPDEVGGTRIHIQFACNPPGGAIGRAVSALLGDDPRATVDEDLDRLKAAIEAGSAPRGVM